MTFRRHPQQCAPLLRRTHSTPFCEAPVFPHCVYHTAFMRVVIYVWALQDGAWLRGSAMTKA